MSKKHLAVLFVVFSLFLLQTTSSLADEFVYNGNNVMIVTDDEQPQKAEGLKIKHIAIAPHDGGVCAEEPTQELYTGATYCFLIELDTPQCIGPIGFALGFFRGGKMVYQLTGTDGDDKCGIVGIGTTLKVPDNAPAGLYTWGARVGEAQFYPAEFEIVQ